MAEPFDFANMGNQEDYPEMAANMTDRVGIWGLLVNRRRADHMPAFLSQADHAEIPANVANPADNAEMAANVANPADNAEMAGRMGFWGPLANRRQVDDMPAILHQPGQIQDRARITKILLYADKYPDEYDEICKNIEFVAEMSVDIEEFRILLYQEANKAKVMKYLMVDCHVLDHLLSKIIHLPKYYFYIINLCKEAYEQKRIYTICDIKGSFDTYAISGRLSNIAHNIEKIIGRLQQLPKNEFIDRNHSTLSLIKTKIQVILAGLRYA